VQPTVPQKTGRSLAESARETGTGLSAPRGGEAREAEVSRLVAQGLSNAQAAERLFPSPRTVDQHLRSIYGKLGVDNRIAAARLAVVRGLA
jgi:DNA-binding NarL/FixJ family response regulator